MSYQPIPTEVDGSGTREVITSDDDAQQMMALILNELRKINLQLALLTGTTIKDGERL